jgi:hypothetical protein
MFIETDSPDVTVTSLPVQGAPGARAYRVTQRISKPGDQSHTARFVCTKAGREITATVLISSFGEGSTGAGRSTSGAREEQP